MYFEQDTLWDFEIQISNSAFMDAIFETNLGSQASHKE
jgi:hypothetical protein